MGNAVVVEFPNTGSVTGCATEAMETTLSCRDPTMCGGGRTVEVECTSKGDCANKAMGTTLLCSDPTLRCKCALRPIHVSR
jgi:hypothetical protein